MGRAVRGVGWGTGPPVLEYFLASNLPLPLQFFMCKPRLVSSARKGCRGDEMNSSSCKSSESTAGFHWAPGQHSHDPSVSLTHDPETCAVHPPVPMQIVTCPCRPTAGHQVSDVHEAQACLLTAAFDLEKWAHLGTFLEDKK